MMSVHDLIEESRITGVSLTGKDISATLVAEMRACRCTCCADGIERIRCGAFIAYACDCDDRCAEERCECRFCVRQASQ